MQITHLTIEEKLSSTRTMSAACFATSLPDPIPTPISDFFSAGESLTPSPVIAIICLKTNQRNHVSRIEALPSLFAFLDNSEFLLRCGSGKDKRFSIHQSIPIIVCQFGDFLSLHDFPVLLTIFLKTLNYFKTPTVVKAYVFHSGQTNLSSDSRGRYMMISCNHEHLDPGLLTLSNGLGGFISGLITRRLIIDSKTHWIHNGANPNKRQIFEGEVVLVSIELFVSVIGKRQMSKSDYSSSMLSIRFIGTLQIYDYAQYLRQFTSNSCILSLSRSAVSPLVTRIFVQCLK